MKLHQIRDKLQSGQKIHDLHLQVVYYARVSTDKDAQLHSLDTQVSYYEQLIQAHPNWAFCGGYIDEGLSGTSVLRRKAFNRMIQDAKDGLFNLIITKETSRFSRNTLDSIHYTRELLRHSVGVFFEFDGICTFDQDAEEWLTMRAMMAQSEVRKLSARTKFGLAFARSNGVVLGNAPYGYLKANKKLTIYEEEAEVVRLIFHLYANELLGARRICERLRELGCKPRKGDRFNYTTINGIISNPKYIGFYCEHKTRQIDFLSKKTELLSRSEWQLIQDTTGTSIPAIISEALWKKANHLLDKRGKKSGRAGKEQYPYSGKIFCVKDGLPFYRDARSYQGEVWICKARMENGKKNCSSPVVYTSALDTVMKEIINALIRDKNLLAGTLLDIYAQTASRQTLAREIKKIRAEIEKQQNRIHDLVSMLLEGTLSREEFLSYKARTAQTVSSLENRLAQLMQEEKQSQDASGADELKRHIIFELELTEGLDRHVSEVLLDRIDVDLHEAKFLLIT